jgi:hypothetical protein
MQSFRLGSILGFEIRVDLSWLLIFVLIPFRLFLKHHHWILNRERTYITVF